MEMDRHLVMVMAIRIRRWDEVHPMAMRGSIRPQAMADGHRQGHPPLLEVTVGSSIQDLQYEEVMHDNPHQGHLQRQEVMGGSHPQVQSQHQEVMGGSHPQVQSQHQEILADGAHQGRHQHLEDMLLTDHESHHLDLKGGG